MAYSEVTLLVCNQIFEDVGIAFVKDDLGFYVAKSQIFEDGSLNNSKLMELVKDVVAYLIKK
jgi:hypothetical protein